MVEVEAKGKAHASGSEPENESSIKNADSQTAASELTKLNVKNSAAISVAHASGSEPENKADGDTAARELVNVEMSAAISGAHAGSEPENKSPIKNIGAETAASEPVTSNMEVPAAYKEKEKKNEENNKEKEDHTLSATVENSRKRKKPGKKLIKQNKTPIKNSNAETAASEVVKLNGEVSAAIPGGEEKKEEEKKEENQEENNKEKVDCTPPAKGKNVRKRKRKRVTKPVKKASVKNADAETGASELVKLNVVPAAISGGEEKKEENKKEQKNKEKVDAPSTTGENLRKRKRKKATLGSAKGIDKPETSTKEKDAKKSESMGMIFMCSSKTKQDCYRYKVLGLPATKKDLVAKIYKGMRLFLFDIDLKLLYGIYKAEGPGGYNIEPKAFNSAFPSQVRFSAMEDCLPLAEEKFKAVIKDNYYAKNKFDCVLKAEQVKNLCNLFKVSGKDRESKPVSKDRKTEAPSHVDWSRERRQGRDRERRQGTDRERRHGTDRERRQGRDREVRQGRDRERRQGRDRVRRPVSGDRRVLEADGIYGREAFAPSVHLPRLPPYAYERPLDTDYFRREAELERYERQHLDLELNRREEIAYRDARVYRDPPLAHEPSISYHDPLYTRAPPLVREPLSYHEPSSVTRAPPAYQHLPALYRY